MTLIHTALLCEAQAVIEKYKLKLVQKNPRIYTNEKIVLLVGGIGKENSLKNLEEIFKNYKISKALNIGIAGCSDTNISIGSLFCTNHNLPNIDHLPLQTVDTPKVQQDEYHPSTLYDMEGSYFLDVAKSYLNEKDIFIFKVVSDYLDDTIPPKDFVKKLIQNSISSWEKWI
jgi:nucleoside phosphorylase